MKKITKLAGRIFLHFPKILKKVFYFGIKSNEKILKTLRKIVYAKPFWYFPPPFNKEDAFFTLESLFPFINTEKKTDLNYLNVFPKDYCVDIILYVDENTKDSLENCINNVLEFADLRYNLLIINDTTTHTEPSVFFKTLLEKNPQIKLIQNNRPLGFTKSVNKALSFSHNDVLLLSPHCLVSPFFLSKLMYPLVKDPSIASSTPLMDSPAFPYKFLAHQFNKFTFEECYNAVSILKTDLENYSFIPYTNSLCVGISRKSIEKIGAFKPSLSYSNAIPYWGLKAIRKGFKHVLANNLFCKDTEKNPLRNTLPKQKKYNDIIYKVMNTHKNTLIWQFIALNLSMEKKSKALFIINHNLGGGAISVSDSFIRKELSENANTLIFEIRVSSNVCFININFNNIYLNFPHESLFIVYELIKMFSFDLCVVNHLIGFTELSILYKLLSLFNCPINFIFHDFFFLCPMYTLTENYKKEFCNLPQKSVCETCYEKSYLTTDEISRSFLISSPTIEYWREMQLKILERGKDFTAYSQTTKEYYAKVYPSLEAKIQIKPFPLLTTPRKVRPYEKVKDKITIAIVGNIHNISKGINIVNSIIDLIKFNKNIELILVGNSPINTIKKIYYNKALELPLIMEQNKVSLCFVPSVCPETFCSVAQEIMEMKMPLAVFNIGAPSERVKNYEKGLIISKIDAKTALDEIISFVQNNLN